LEDKGPEPARRILVVQPGADDSSNGIYDKLEQAILAARPGDVIRLRSNSELQVGPVALDRKDLVNLTIQPMPGWHPVLVLAGRTDPDAALFAVHGGNLRLEK